jgi:hypothetical protein
VSNEQLNLAQQPEPPHGESTNKSGSPGQVYADEELVRRAKADDPWAIEQLVLRYQQKVYAIAYQMLGGDAEEARDRTQDAFFAPRMHFCRHFAVSSGLKGSLLFIPGFTAS